MAQGITWDVPLDPDSDALLDRALHSAHVLGDALVLANLRRLRETSALRRFEGSTDRHGALSYDFIVGRVRTVSGERWSTAKARELFGSRAAQKGPPAYRWQQLLTLTSALNVTLLDLILPHEDHVGYPDREDRDRVKEATSRLLCMPTAWLSAETRGKLGRERRSQALLEQALRRHPKVAAVSRRLAEDPDFEAALDHYVRLGNDEMALLRVKVNGRKSELLEELTSTPEHMDLLKLKGADIGFFSLVVTEMTEETAFTILDELGLFTKGAN